MRRGRPSKSESEKEVHKPNPSPMRGVQRDPFLALDSKAPSASAVGVVDDVSTRFPPIDEFSILSDTTTKFAFDPDPGIKTKVPKDISQRVTDALADDAFARPSRVYEAAPLMPKNIQSNLALTIAIQNSAETSRGFPARLSTGPLDMPQRPTMVSIGTMTSPSPPSTDKPNLGSPPPVSALSSSDQDLSATLQALETVRSAPSTLKPAHGSTGRPRFLDHRSKSHTSSHEVSRLPGSSRPSLEGQRPAKLDFEGTVNRSKSASSRSRPSSVYAHPKNAFLSGQEHLSEEAKSSQTYEVAYSRNNGSGEPESSIDASKNRSNVDYLRAMEDEDPSRKKEKRLSSGSKHSKRASLPSISLSSTKSLLAGRFGDAFRRFETNMGGSGQRASSPSSDYRERILTPITGSEATDDRSDDGQVFEETEPISPEVRRELERQRYSQEEKRVAIAAAAHRQKFSHMGDHAHERSGEAQSHNRAASIQSKVKTLLDRNGGESPVRTEAGFQRYSQQLPRQNPTSNLSSENPLQAATPQTLKKPPPNKLPHDLSTTSPSSVRATSKTTHLPFASPSSSLPPSISSTTTPSTDRPYSRPSAPPKPHALRTGNREPDLISSTSPAKPASIAANHISAVSSGRPASRHADGVISPGSDDWEEKFSKKYPSLAGLEMVERNIDLAR